MTLRVDDIGFGGLKLTQNTEEFCYGVDAVILADMASKCGRFNESYNAVDLGTGTGIIPLILTSRIEGMKITGYDVIGSNIELARKNAENNGLEERLEFECMDVIDIPDKLKQGIAGLVTCNPPYFRRGGGIVNDNSAKFVARQETTAEVDDFVKAAAHILRERGHFCMIHRPDRLVDIMSSCRAHRLEPKELRMVAPKENEVPNMVLVHCIKGAGKELKIIPSLNVYKTDKSGEYTDELLGIYGREK